MPPRVFDALRQDDARFQNEVLNAIREIGPDAGTAVPAITPLLKSQDPGVRSQAARVLIKLGPSAREAIPALVSLLKQEDDRSLLETEVALREIGAASIPALISVMKNENPKIRARAESVLNQLVPVTPPDVADFGKGLRDLDVDVRRALAMALANSKTIPPELVPALIEVSARKAIFRPASTL